MDNVEFIITVRCKRCGDIMSVKATMDSDTEKGEARTAIDNFAADHKHSPWVV